MWQWLVDHQAVLGALIVAIIDFAWAMSERLRSNGILQAVYNIFKKDPASKELE